MAQVTIRDVDEGTLTVLRRRAAARGRTLSAELREILASEARGRHSGGAFESDISEEEAWAGMERIWEEMKSEPPVSVSGAELIREGREERWARIDPRMAALERVGREKK